MFQTKAFGAHLAKLRKHARWTQTELAQRLNLTRQAVSKYETGESFPDISILLQMAAIFETTVDSLVAGVSPPVPSGTFGAFAQELQKEGMNISPLLSLVQLLQEPNGTAEAATLWEKVLPFLDTASKEVVVRQIIEGERDWRLLAVLMPYIENMTGQLEAAFVDGALPREAQTICNEYWIRKNRK